MNAKESFLKPLLESSNGLHLTIYANKCGTTEDLQRQLRRLVDNSRSYLAPVLPPHLERDFLDPVRTIVGNSKILESFTGNIAIFRTSQTLRMLSIPVEVDPTVAVANTFHVKPLLRWMQANDSYFLIGLTETGLSLYRGHDRSIELLDAMPIETAHLQSESSKEDLRRWISAWASSEYQNLNKRIFVAGDSARAASLIEALSDLPMRPLSVLSPFSSDLLPTYVEQILQQLSRETSDVLESAMNEFHLAEELRLAKRNLFEIAKAAAQGRISKLIVADGVKVFGKLDPATGGLSLNPIDTDHEDDDILDDLAQLVLNKGGQVIVADRSRLPKGRTVLAIVKSKRK